MGLPLICPTTASTTTESLPVTEAGGGRMGAGSGTTATGAGARSVRGMGAVEVACSPWKSAGCRSTTEGCSATGVHPARIRAAPVKTRMRGNWADKGKAPDVLRITKFRGCYGLLHLRQRFFRSSANGSWDLDGQEGRLDPSTRRQNFKKSRPQDSTLRSGKPVLSLIRSDSNTKISNAIELRTGHERSGRP